MVPYGHTVANNQLPRELHVHQLGLTTRLVFWGPYPQLMQCWTEPAVLKVIAHSCLSGLAGAHWLVLLLASRFAYTCSPPALPPGSYGLTLTGPLVHIPPLSLYARSLLSPPGLHAPALALVSDMDPIDGWLSTPPLINVNDGLGWWTAMELTGHPLLRMSLNFCQHQVCDHLFLLSLI
jgi:hypothetical protein